MKTKKLIWVAIFTVACVSLIVIAIQRNSSTGSGSKSVSPHLKNEIQSRQARPSVPAKLEPPIRKTNDKQPVSHLASHSSTAKIEQLVQELRGTFRPGGLPARCCGSEPQWYSLHFRSAHTTYGTTGLCGVCA